MADNITVITGDRCETTNSRTPIVVILDRLRSVHNVGNILRLADAVNALEVACCGYTACPPHPKLAKAAMGAENIVSTKYFETACNAIDHYSNEGFKIVAIETVDKAENLMEFSFDQPTALVLGNEALGIQTETLERCDAYVKLPALGLKNSINVSNCAAVALFQAAQQLR